METFEIIDSNVRIGESIYSIIHSANQYLKAMKKVGVEKAIISSFTPPDLDFEKANSVIERVLKAHPSKFAGSIRVDPRQKESLRILRKFAKNNGFVCIHIDPFEQSFKVNSPQIYPVYEFAEKRDYPMMIESGYPLVSTPLQVAEIANEFRKVKFIMTHAGQLLASGQSEADAGHAMNENRNLYCDTSQIILSGLGGFIEQLVASNINSTASRILFGSNSPAGELSVEIMRVERAGIDEEKKRLIFCENAKKLFNI